MSFPVFQPAPPIRPQRSNVVNQALQILALQQRMAQRQAEQQEARDRLTLQLTERVGQNLVAAEGDLQAALAGIPPSLRPLVEPSLPALEKRAKQVKQQQKRAELLGQVETQGGEPGALSRLGAFATQNAGGRQDFSTALRQSGLLNLAGSDRAQLLNRLGQNISVARGQQQMVEAEQEAAVNREIQRELRLSAVRQRNQQKQEQAQRSQQAAEIADVASAAGIPLRSARAAERLARLQEQDKTFADPIFGVPIRGNETDLRSAQQRASVVDLVGRMEAAAEEFAEKVGGTAFTGTLEEAKRLLGEADPIFAEYSAIQSQANLIIAVSRGGRQLTEFELNMVNQSFPAASELRFENGRLSGGARQRLAGLKDVIASEYAAPFGSFYDKRVVQRRVRSQMDRRDSPRPATGAARINIPDTLPPGAVFIGRDEQGRPMFDIPE